MYQCECSFLLLAGTQPFSVTNILCYSCQVFKRWRNHLTRRHVADIASSWWYRGDKMLLWLLFCDFHVLILIEGLQRQSSESWGGKILRLSEDKPRNTWKQWYHLSLNSCCHVSNEYKSKAFHAFVLSFVLAAFFLEMLNWTFYTVAHIHLRLKRPYSKCDSFIGTGWIDID